MTGALFAAWLRAFVVTELVEAPIYRYGYGAPWGAALAASAVTHPVVWFVFFGPLGASTGASYAERLVAAELFAWLAEAALLTAITRRPRALAWSLAANAASVAVGLALRSVWPAF